MMIRTTSVSLSRLLSSVWAIPRRLLAQNSDHGSEIIQPPQYMPTARSGSIKGRVAEIEEGGIVLEGTYKGKIQEIYFMTSDKTRKEGKIETGSVITVRFCREEELSGMLYATRLKGSKPR